MLELCKKGIFTKEKIVEKMCHNPAILYRIKDRGFLREGYFADIVLVDPECEWKVTGSNILYKCGWSPFMNRKFSTQVICTIVNGEIVFANGIPNDEIRGKEIEFND
jgi:dihydroorotase